MRCYHEFGPFYNQDSKILILGSFPSVKSREAAFYYAHPQNRFWKVLAGCYKEAVPVSLIDKQQFLNRHQIALWDVIESCEIVGSSDASIKEIEPAAIDKLVHKLLIKAIILNGKTAKKHFDRMHWDFSIPVYALPSTSAANAQFGLDRLIEHWRIILNFNEESEADKV